MAFTLYTGEMLAAMKIARHPRADELRQRYCELNTRIATELASFLNIAATPDALNDFDDGRFAAVFAPKRDGQELPEAIADFDGATEWGA